jgi:MFS family permease
VPNSKKNIAALAVLQGLLITNNVTVISLGSLTGYMLAQQKSLATLPATAYIAGGACSTFLLSQLMRRYGRRAGFTVGALAGMTGAAICTTAVALQSFWLFCLGTLIAGLYTAAGGYYRFAAADVVSEDFKSRAISFVLAGGIIGGVLGPESSKITKSLLSKTFMGSYAALIVFALVALAVIRLLDIPPPKGSEYAGRPRPLGTIVRQPIFVVACLSAVTSYAVMNLMMGATPLAMQMCGLPFASAALVIESHIIGMFAPALFAGRLIKRFGVLRIMGVGVLMYLVCVLAALEGQRVINFWLSGTLLGAGWCFLYVGGTTLLTEAYRPEEKAKAQGINDMLVFVVMGTSSAISGAILYRLGWNALNLFALPLLVATGIAVIWLALGRRAQSRALVPVPPILE